MCAWRRLEYKDCVVKRFYLCALFLAFCSAEAEPPPLVPREILFGNPARTDPKVSPDGSQLSWLAPDKSNTLNVWTSALDGTNAHCVTNETGDPIEWYTWAGDGKHVLYLHDNAGDEIPHLFSADLMTGNVRDLTPFRGVRAQNVLTDSRHPAAVLVAMNLRDRTKFDMYRVDLETGAITIEAQNPGDVLTWRADNNFVLRAATAFDGTTGRTIIRARDAADKPWRDLVVMPFERALFAGEVVNGSLIVGFDPDDKSLLIVSALHSDKGRLVRVDLQDGHELGVIADDPRCDVAFVDVGRLGMEPGVILHSVTGAVQAVEFNYMTPQWSFVDPKLKTDFENINRKAPGFVDLVSRDNADRVWIVALRRSDAPVTYYKFDRETKKLSQLFTENPALAKFALAPKKPVIIKARDGLEMVSYLTTPPGMDPKKLPLVLLIHGGPWMLCVGPWIKGSLIQSESRRWEDRWEVSPRCARWKCGLIFLRVALMNVGQPTRRRACAPFLNIGPILWRVGGGAREMPIMIQSGIEKSRRFIMPMRSVLRFSSVRARTILESHWLMLTRWSQRCVKQSGK